MARVHLDISDTAGYMTLKALLEADGHEVSDDQPDVSIADEALAALEHAKDRPTLVLAAANQVRAAVAVMRQGVYGYIFIPLQPGEAEIMVRRAAGAKTDSTHEPPCALAEVEEKHILNTLRYCKNNRAEAARILGIGRNTLWRKLKAFEQAHHAGYKPDE